VSTTQSLAGSLCNATSQLVGCYLLLPNTCGSTFLQIIEKELESLIFGVKQFVEKIHNLILKKYFKHNNFVFTVIFSKTFIYVN
jgi:hypothetical protein